MVRARRGTRAEGGREPAPAQPPDQRRGEDGDEDDRDHHVRRREQLEPGRRVFGRGRPGDGGDGPGREVERVGEAILEGDHRQHHLEGERDDQPGAGGEEQAQGVVDDPHPWPVARHGAGFFAASGEVLGDDLRGREDVDLGGDLVELVGDGAVEHRHPERQLRPHVSAQQGQPQGERVVAGDHRGRRPVALGEELRHLAVGEAEARAGRRPVCSSRRSSAAPSPPGFAEDEDAGGARRGRGLVLDRAHERGNCAGPRPPARSAAPAEQAQRDAGEEGDESRQRRPAPEVGVGAAGDRPGVPRSRAPCRRWRRQAPRAAIASGLPGRSSAG